MRRYGIQLTYSIEGEQPMAPSKWTWREAIRSNSGRHDSVARAGRLTRRHQVRRPGGPTISHRNHGFMASGPRDLDGEAMGSESLGVGRGMIGVEAAIRGLSGVNRQKTIIQTRHATS